MTSALVWRRLSRLRGLKLFDTSVYIPLSDRQKVRLLSCLRKVERRRRPGHSNILKNTTRSRMTHAARARTESEGRREEGSVDLCRGIPESHLPPSRRTGSQGAERDAACGLPYHRSGGGKVSELARGWESSGGRGGLGKCARVFPLRESVYAV